MVRIRFSSTDQKNFNAKAGTPRWSPDGRYIAFDSPKSGTPDIYVVSAQGGPVRRITYESSANDMPSWSHDGKWIYFESDRSRDFSDMEGTVRGRNRRPSDE